MPYLDDEQKNKKKTESKKDIALDKFELEDAPKRKKTDKISGRKNQNPFVRFAIDAFPQADDPPNEKFRKAFLLIAVAVLIGALLFLGWQILSIAKGSDTNSKIAEFAGVLVNKPTGSYRQPDRLANPSASIASEAGDDEPEYIDLTPVVNTPLEVNFNNLLSVNPDTRGWIKITGTMINNVIVQSDDNDYYLNHDFYDNTSIAGTIFSSANNTWDGTDDNTILFGHNMHNGEMFAYVMHYVPNDSSREPIAFYKVHPTVMMATPDGGSATYKIFAGMICNTQTEYGEVFDYVNKTKFRNADDFNNFILEVMDRSWFFTDVDLKYGDELLTLSTCYWPLGKQVDTRWVVMARKVRPGEDEYVDTSKAYRNYQAKLFDYYYKQIHGSWSGSVWDKSKLLSY